MESLADIGLATMKRFKLLQEAELESVEKQSLEWPKHHFLAQFERFELWAVNLGVFVMGHGSLDYRIRDSESMKEAILKMMKNLNRSLDEVLAYLHGNIEQEDEDSDADSDSELESDMDLLLDSIKDPVDRLYKMAVWIRNPSTRIASSKARNFQQIDEKTNIDLFKSYETFDYDYVSSLFLEYEKNKALQENPTAQHHDATGDNEEPAVGDQVWEPIRQTLELNRIKISNGNESYLVHRIAQANGLRRRQFAYWRKHKGKLHEHTAVTVELLSHKLPTGDNIIQDESKRHKAPLTVTTATQLHPSHGAGKEILENENIMPLAVSEYAPSAWNPSKDIVSFPSPPKVSTTDEFFECPYCYTICPASILSEKAWRAHLIRDLRPYICTFEHCSNSEQLYDSRDDWIQHETSAHQTVFRCPKHEEITFTTLSAYEEHTQNYHKEDSMSLNFAKSTITNNQRSCPVCSIVLGSMQKLQSHIALHLERFAMFALPRCTDNGDREDYGGRSASAHFDSDRSLNGDLDAESNATGKIGDDNFINHEILTKIRGMGNEIAKLRSPVQIQSWVDDGFFYEQMKRIRSVQLKNYGKITRAWPPSDTANIALFELGEICIAAGLIDEAIETLEHLQFFQTGQLEHDDPALLRTKQHLAIAYQANEAIQEVTKKLGPDADLHTEPNKSKALDIFSRTEAGMRHAETIWGPGIWEIRQVQKGKERDSSPQRPTLPRRQSSLDAFDRRPLPNTKVSPPAWPYDERLVLQENNPEISHVGQYLDNADDSTRHIQEAILSKDYEQLRDMDENSRNIQPSTDSHHVAALEESVEELDPRYRFEPSSKFQPGEIFKILWPETQGASSEDTSSESSKYEVQSRVGTRCVVGFRRFIVIASDLGHCTCVPILTYGGNGCTKKGVKPNEHGIIYERGSKPRLLDKEPKLGFPPVRVDIKEEGENLSKESRVNYSKLVTVEHNIKVFFIGSIVVNDWEIVSDAVNHCWNERNPHSSRGRRSPRSDDEAEEPQDQQLQDTRDDFRNQLEGPSFQNNIDLVDYNRQGQRHMDEMMPHGAPPPGPLPQPPQPLSPSPEKEHLKKEFAEFKAEQERAREAAKQRELEEKIRKDFDEAFIKKLEELGLQKQEAIQAIQETDRARLETEHITRERIEAEKKAEEDRRQQHADLIAQPKATAEIKFQAEPKAAEERRRREDEDRARAEEAARLRLETAIRAESAAMAAAEKKASDEAARTEKAARLPVKVAMEAEADAPAPAPAPADGQGPGQADVDRQAPRFNWTPAYEATIFRSLCESVQLGLRENNTFKDEAWERAALALQEHHGVYPAKGYLINRSDDARKSFRLWRSLREDPDFIYNPVTRTVTATEEAWRAHIAREPLSRALRGRPFDHEEYMELLYPDVINDQPDNDSEMPKQPVDWHPALSGDAVDELKEGVLGYLVPLDPKYGDRPLVVRKRVTDPTSAAVKASSLAAKVKHIAAGGYLIGRHHECDLIISELAVSNRHCLIFEETVGTDTIAVVEDLSSNGTCINEDVIGRNQRRELKDEDEIAVHDKARFIFRYPKPGNNDDFTTVDAYGEDWKEPNLPNRPDTRDDLPVLNTIVGQETTHNQHPPLQGGMGADMHQMAPPAINIDFAPATNSRQGSFEPPKLHMDQDSLTPPGRGRPKSRPKAVTDPFHPGSEILRPGNLGPSLGVDLAARSDTSSPSVSPVEEDSEMREEREYIEAELSLFTHIVRELEDDISAEIALEDQDVRLKSEARTLAQQMTLLNSSVEELRSQFLMESQKSERSEKAHLLTAKIRSFDLREMRKKLTEIQNERRARDAQAIEQVLQIREAQEEQEKVETQARQAQNRA